MAQGRPSLLLTIILPLLLGGMCLILGAWKALIERGQGEYGISNQPGDRWSFLWVGIAALVLAIGVVVAMRNAKHKWSPPLFARIALQSSGGTEMLRMLLMRLIANKVVSRLPIQRPAITFRQKVGALLIAGVVDLIQIVLFPFFLFGLLEPTQLALDAIACVSLAIICGARWQFALAFLVELIPGMSIFPTWTAFVLGMPTRKCEPIQPLQLDGSRVVRVTDARIRPQGA